MHVSALETYNGELYSPPFEGRAPASNFEDANPKRSRTSWNTRQRNVLGTPCKGPGRSSRKVHAEYVTPKKLAMVTEICVQLESADCTWSEQLPVGGQNASCGRTPTTQSALPFSLMNTSGAVVVFVSCLFLLSSWPHHLLHHHRHHRQKQTNATNMSRRRRDRVWYVVVPGALHSGVSHAHRR